MTYGGGIVYHLHMPLCFLGTFTEYPVEELERNPLLSLILSMAGFSLFRKISILFNKFDFLFVTRFCCRRFIGIAKCDAV